MLADDHGKVRGSMEFVAEDLPGAMEESTIHWIIIKSIYLKIQKK